ncbi:hypothetical protein [Kitasatospora griseola]|nr:hypothetical protein [Kitasatospora griseola]
MEEIVSFVREPEIRATPVDGCDVCIGLNAAWFKEYDRDLLIEINNHPHTTPKLTARVGKILAEAARRKAAEDKKRARAERAAREKTRRPTGAVR